MPVLFFAIRRVIAATLLFTITAAAPAPAAETVDIDLPDLVAAFRKHCVRVYIQGKTHEGKPPAVGDFAADIGNERPTPVGGYWWDDRHVVIEDIGIQDQFIHSVEIGLPFTDHRYPARIAGRFVKLQAILLEVLPGEEGVMPQSFPLEFVDGDIEEAGLLSYLWEDGDWRIKADVGLGASAISDSGVETVELTGPGVFVDETGAALGLAFGSKVTLDAETDYWRGRELAYTPVLAAAEAAAKTADLRSRLAQGVLETRFRLRVKVEEDEDQDWMLEIDEDGKSVAEVRAAGLVTGPRHLLVPLTLTAEGIARIEEIEVVGEDGKIVPASYAGTFRDYMAVLVETASDLPDDRLPPGFAMLNPFLVPEEAFEPAASGSGRPEMEYMQRWHVDYALGRRRERADGDRWMGTFRGYRGDVTVLTLTNEEDGGLAFDVRGRLAAVALTPRILSARGRDGSRRKGSPGFKPLDFLHAKFQGSDVFDPTIAPVAEEQGRRLVDFGVEYQGLDADTARLFSAAAATRGGRIGLLVTHVYPGSLAEKAGIREHDVLLRLRFQDRNEPSELRAERGGGGNLFEFDDMSADSIQQALAFMPPPWPGRDNVLSNLLTAAGIDRRVEVEYLREGEPARASFVTVYAEADYRNVRKERFANLGLTVKPITFEVARYFRRENNSGVIISKAEEGGRGSVAGLHQYLLITHVDGAAVEGMDDFRAKTRRFEEGGAPSVELTVEGFGKTRLVKIE